jgi:hypothetical protein
MIAVPAGMRVLVATKPVDFRKGADGYGCAPGARGGRRPASAVDRTVPNLCGVRRRTPGPPPFFFIASWQQGASWRRRPSQYNQITDSDRRPGLFFSGHYVFLDIM